MGRHKRYPDAEKLINNFYASVSEAYHHPGVDEKSQDGRKPQALLAEEFGISRLKVRKILITTGEVVYPETKRIQELLVAGMKKQDVCEYLNMALSTLNSFLPYEKGVYNLTDVSIYADSSRIYWQRKAAVHALQADLSPYTLWHCICLFAGYSFAIGGREDQAGIRFKYEVCTSELLIIRAAGGKQEMRIHRSSFDDALKNVLDYRKKGEEITDPEQLNVEGGRLYLQYV